MPPFIDSASLAATIVIPTHNHGPTLYSSVASALAQTVPVEVFVIGDGVTDETRAVAQELERGDPRVRFFDRAKSPRRGEAHRHQALQGARGRIVCYLSDDDIYLPHHVEDMGGLLQDADFAHAQAIEVLPGGGVTSWAVDLELAAFQREVLSGQNRVPLSAAAHTLEAYRRLPKGWSDAPPGFPSDLFMWRKFVNHPGCRFRAGWRPSVLVFPSPKRKNYSNQDRLGEMRRWTAETAGEAAVARLTQSVLTAKTREMAAVEARVLDAAAGTLAPPQKLQVFFPTAQRHNEAESAFFPLRPGAWERIEVRFAAPSSPASIRIDPCHHPASIEIQDLSVRDASGKTLWELTEDSAHLLRVEGTAVPVLAGRPFVAVSDGDDPRMILPPLAFPGGEASLEVTIRVDADPVKQAAFLAQGLRALQSKRVPLRRVIDRFFRRS